MEVAVGDRVQFVPTGKARICIGHVRKVDDRCVTVTSMRGYFTVPYASVKAVLPKEDGER